MSSEWWSILLVFWGLYLADGLRGGRRPRLYIHGWRSPFAQRTPGATRPGPKSSVTQSSWFLIPPIPSAWALIADDLPASLAPDGITNWPSCCASRPPPFPDRPLSCRWEDILKADDRSGYLRINDRRFTFSTSALPSSALVAFARDLAPLSPTERADRIQSWQTTRFASDSLRRKMRVILLRSRGLACLNTVQAVLLALVTAYLLVDGPARVSPALSDTLARMAPSIVGAFTGLHLLAIYRFYRLHVRFFPKASQERSSVIFTALFVPPQALRLRLHLVSPLARGAHPLAAAKAALHPDGLKTMASAILRDLRWPRRPVGLSAETGKLLRESDQIMDPVILTSLTQPSVPFSVDELLAPPVPVSSSACAYCPRCGDQFTGANARCAHGVPLVPLAKTTPTHDT